MSSRQAVHDLRVYGGNAAVVRAACRKQSSDLTIVSLTQRGGLISQI